jgi:hypothetical protein
MKYRILGSTIEVDDAHDEYTVSEEVVVESKFSQENDPVFLALVTATASKMLEKHEKVQIISCESFAYGDVDTVLYEMIRT